MMGRVSINVNGRKFGLGCEDGEEERLLRLGQKLDDRVKAMADQFGQIGDLRLLVMAGITLLDELEDVNVGVDEKVDARLGDARKESKAALENAEKSETLAIESLVDAAKRIERIAEKISQLRD